MATYKIHVKQLAILGHNQRIFSFSCNNHTNVIYFPKKCNKCNLLHYHLQICIRFVVNDVSLLLLCWPELHSGMEQSTSWWNVPEILRVSSSLHIMEIIKVFYCTLWCVREPTSASSISRLACSAWTQHISSFISPHNCQGFKRFLLHNHFGSVQLFRQFALWIYKRRIKVD